jgi:hypothetical protein
MPMKPGAWGRPFHLGPRTGRPDLAPRVALRGQFKGQACRPFEEQVSRQVRHLPTTCRSFKTTSPFAGHWGQSRGDRVCGWGGPSADPLGRPEGGEGVVDVVVGHVFLEMLTPDRLKGIFTEIGRHQPASLPIPSADFFDVVIGLPSIPGPERQLWVHLVEDVLQTGLPRQLIVDGHDHAFGVLMDQFPGRQKYVHSDLAFGYVFTEAKQPRPAAIDSCDHAHFPAHHLPGPLECDLIVKLSVYYFSVVSVAIPRPPPDRWPATHKCRIDENSEPR